MNVIIPKEELTQKISFYKERLAFYNNLDIKTHDYYRMEGFLAVYEALLHLYESHKPELNIELNEYQYECGDGCCLNYGTRTLVNGEEMPFHNQDNETVLKQVLDHLGYKVNIEKTYDNDES